MSSQLLRALRTWAGPLAPGLERQTTVRDGELELELVLRVRRSPAHETIVRYRAAALELLGGDRHWLVRHCGCLVQKKAPYSRHQADCRGAVVAAVAYRRLGDSPEDAPQFLFICGHHRKSHHIDPRCVLAIVELPSQELAELRKRDEVKAAEWSAKCRAEDEERERAGRRVSS